MTLSREMDGFCQYTCFQLLTIFQKLNIASSLLPFFNFSYKAIFYLPRHRFAEKTSLDLDDLLQQLVELNVTKKTSGLWSSS